MKQTLKQHLWMHRTWNPETNQSDLWEPRVNAFGDNCGYADDWNVYVGPCEFEVEVPKDFDPRQKQLHALNKQLEEQRADNYVKEKKILDAIANLTALTHG